MKKLVVSLSMLLLGAYAQAEVHGPLWTCQIDAARLEGHGFSFIITGTTLEGQGTVTCSSLSGTVTTPVNVELTAGGIGAVIGVVKAQNVDLIGAAVGLRNPDGIFGTYPGVRGTAALIGGEASLSVNFGANEHGVGLGVNLIGSAITKGFRVGAALEGWELTLSQVRQEPWQPVPTPPPAPNPGH